MARSEAETSKNVILLPPSTTSISKDLSEVVQERPAALFQAPQRRGKSTIMAAIAGYYANTYDIMAYCYWPRAKREDIETIERFDRYCNGRLVIAKGIVGSSTSWLREHQNSIIIADDMAYAKEGATHALNVRRLVTVGAGTFNIMALIASQSSKGFSTNLRIVVDKPFYQIHEGKGISPKYQFGKEPTFEEIEPIVKAFSNGIEGRKDIAGRPPDEDSSQFKAFEMFRLGKPVEYVVQSLAGRVSPDTVYIYHWRFKKKEGKLAVAGGS